MKDNDLYSEIERIRPKLEGWCSAEKARAMAQLVVEYRPQVSVEIGVFGGKSLVPQALACDYVEGGHVFGVDPWSNAEAIKDAQHPDNIKFWGGIDMEAIYRGCLTALLENRLTQYCTVFRTTSERACTLFDEIDVLHIDDNHTEQASVLDVFLYLPKVRSGGHIWFDDVDWKEIGEHFSQQRALDLIEERCERIRLIGNCALYRKR